MRTIPYGWYRLRAWNREYTVVSSDTPNGAGVETFANVDEAEQFIRGISFDSDNWQVLQQLHQNEPGRFSVGRSADEALIGDLAFLLFTGELRIAKATEAPLPNVEPSQRQPPKQKKEPELPKTKAWIDVQLLTEDGKPVADEPYQITLPDGAIHEGRTDAQGLVSFANIDPGQCTFTFTRLDGSVWSPA